MTLKAEVLDALLEAGASAEMIVAAVKADMAEDEARREQRREGNAERQRRFKARKRRGNAGNALSDVTPPIEDHTPPVSSDEETSVVAKSKPDKPEDVTPQTWRDFTAHRAKLKFPVSETALIGIRREAVKAGWTMEAALAECVTRGWRAFKADWVAEHKSTGPPGNVSYLDNLHAKLAVSS